MKRFAPAAAVISACLAFALIFASGPARAQSVSIDSVDASAFPEVVVHVSATDFASSCEDLASSMSVTDNGEAALDLSVTPDPVGSGGGLLIVLSADDLMSDFGRMEEARRQAHAILDVAQATERVGIIVYSGCDRVEIEPTTDHARIRSAIDAANPSGSGTPMASLYRAFEWACAHAGLPVVYIGDGFEFGSANCGFPLDGGSDGDLLDDADVLVELASPCGVRLNVVGTRLHNSSLYRNIAGRLDGRVLEDSAVTDADRRSFFGGVATGCGFTVSFRPTDATPDGRAHAIEVCLQGICATDEYFAECQARVSPSAATAAWLGADCNPSQDTRVALTVQGCEEPLAASVFVTNSVETVDFPLVQEGGEWVASLPGSSLIAGEVVEVFFEGTVGADPFRIPASGSHEVLVCDDAPDTSLTISVAEFEGDPGSTVATPIELSGSGLPYIVSFQFDIAFDPTLVTPVRVDVAGSILSQADWISPAWAVVSPGRMRISSAGSGPLGSFGTMFTIQWELASEERLDCSPLGLENCVLNDGYPVAKLQSGQICSGPGCLTGSVVAWDSGLGIGGVDVKLGAEVLVTTDGSGTFSLCDPPSPGSVLLFGGGDADSSELTALDASRVLQATVGLVDFSQPERDFDCAGALAPLLIAADASGNGQVEAYDASLILQYLVARIDELPAGTWVFPCDAREVTTSSHLDPVQGIRVGDVTPAVTRLRPDPMTARLVGRRLHLSGAPLGIELTVRGADTGFSAGFSTEWMSAECTKDGVYRLALARSERAEGVVIDLGQGRVDPGRIELRADGANVEIETGPSELTSRMSWALGTKPGSSEVLLRWSGQSSGEGARIRVFDARGRRVDGFELPPTPDGKMQWMARDHQGRRIASGVYFFRLEEASGAVSTRKVTLLGSR